MRKTIAISVCCVAAVAAGMISYATSDSKTPVAPIAQQVAATQPSAAEPTPVVVTQSSAIQDAPQTADKSDTTSELLAQAPAEMKTEAKSRTKTEPKKRAAPAMQRKLRRQCPTQTATT